MLESEKLDLQEQVVGLEERLDSAHAQNVAHTANDDLNNTITAKDNYIAKLEKETQDMQTVKDKLVSNCLLI